MAFWMFGYGFAFGTPEDTSNRFIGADKFAWQLDSDETGWIFQYAFAATSATIISGSMAERTRFSGYAISTMITTGFIYPVVVKWVWGKGWLYQRGFHDFAGSTVVHITGGFAALIGAMIIRPRTGRFHGDKKKLIEWGAKADKEKFRPSSLALCTLGTLILWFGWFGFNCGSGLSAYGTGARRRISLVAVNTVMGPAGAIFCALMMQLLNPFSLGGISLKDILNSLLAGLVGITAGCDIIAPYAAFLIGAVSSLIYRFGSKFVLKCGIDDVVGAASVHFMSGCWGTIAVGFTADCGVIRFLEDTPCNDPAASNMTAPNCSLCAGGELFGVQLYGSIAVMAWVGMTAGIVFSSLQLCGILRVTKQEEADGLDHSYNMMKKKGTFGADESKATSVVPTTGS